LLLGPYPRLARWLNGQAKTAVVSPEAV